jgi:hypothetical protein
MAKQPFFLAALLWVTFYAVVSQGADLLDPEQQIEKVGWDIFLAELPEQLKFHVTIERLSRAPGGEKIGESPFDDCEVTLEANITTVDRIVEKLQREMKGVKVVRNKNNPVICHLIDERLLKIKHYVLDKEVDIAYSGPIDDLADELGKVTPAIKSAWRGGAIGEVLGDFRTQVRVRAKDESVREVLTECVPLKHYNRTLWIARTTKTNDNYLTTVRYQGQRWVREDEKSKE